MSVKWCASDSEEVLVLVRLILVRMGVALGWWRWQGLWRRQGLRRQGLGRWQVLWRWQGLWRQGLGRWQVLWRWQRMGWRFWWQRQGKAQNKSRDNCMDWRFARE